MIAFLLAHRFELGFALSSLGSVVYAWRIEKRHRWTEARISVIVRELNELHESSAVTRAFRRSLEKKG